MGMPKYVLMTVQSVYYKQKKIVEKWENQSMENMQSIQIGQNTVFPSWLSPDFCGRAYLYREAVLEIRFGHQKCHFSM